MLITTSAAVQQRQPISRQTLVDTVKKEAAAGGPFDKAKQAEADSFLSRLEKYEGQTLDDIRTDASFKALNHYGKAEGWKQLRTASQVTVGVGAVMTVAGHLLSSGASSALQVAGGVALIGGYMSTLLTDQQRYNNEVLGSRAANTAIQLTNWDNFLRQPEAPVAG